jgi:hypothetical protein
MAKDKDKYGIKETRANIKKYGPLKSKPKKELTLEERQPRKLFPNKTEAVNNMMFARQKKKKAVPGTMKGKQVDTTKGPNMSATNKPIAKPAPARKKLINKKTDIKYGPDKKIMDKVVEKFKPAEKTDLRKLKTPDSGPAPKKKEEKFDRMAAARNQQRMAQKSMGFKKGGTVKRDGCAVRGKTKGRMV